MVWPWSKKAEAPKKEPEPEKKSYRVPTEMIITATATGVNGGDHGIYGISRPSTPKGVERHIVELKRLNLSVVDLKDSKNDMDVVGLYEPTGILYRFVGFVNMKDSTVTLNGKVIKKLEVNAKGTVTDEEGRVVE